jgi:phenylalanyl-tRNA synthetase alpha subunit
MRAHEFLDERKKKRKLKNAAYGPGPYGWYGYDSGYSGDGGVEENFVDKVVDTVKKTVTPNNPVKDMRDKVQSGQVKDAGSNSVFQKMSDRNKDMQQAIDDATKEDIVKEKWSQKYKSSINCSNPKGFSQRAHCAGKNK